MAWIRPGFSTGLLVILTVLLACGFPALAKSKAKGKEDKLPKGFVYLRAVDTTILQQIRYATPNNFTGIPVPGYEQPACILTVPAAMALQAVQKELAPLGYGLFIYDCYRPVTAVKAFGRWAKDYQHQAFKYQYYPRVSKSQLFDEGYIAWKSSHSRGSTVDLTIIDWHASQGAEILEMGTPFDYFDPLAQTDAPGITPAARKNRDLLRTLMEAHGFKNLPKEWWHYTLVGEPFPKKYFNFPVR